MSSPTKPLAGARQARTFASGTSIELVVSFLVNDAAVPRAEPARSSETAGRRLKGVAIAGTIPVLVSTAVVILWAATGR